MNTNRILKGGTYKMYSTITTGALQGVSAYLVSVETDISPGLPTLNLVGSLSQEVREARDRVGVALRNVGLNLPPSRITVNLAPANRRKALPRGTIVTFIRGLA